VFGIHDFWLFVLSGLLLNISPGPDTAYVVGRSVQLGCKGGTAAALGIGAGCCVHIGAAAFGLSAVLATSAVAFGAVKVLGAAYLCYLGLRMLFARAEEISSVADVSNSASARLSTVFWQGMLTNVLNPKVALFFLAFLPQFIDAGASSKALAFLFLGVVFDVNGTLWNMGVAWVSSRAAGSLRRADMVRVWIDRTLGGLFLYLGFRLAVMERG
jgi:threonine/homoserine/homoserine lactone efflux protein